ncbi:type IV toxin-antitoxin system AbiEi family antitoxin [Idiomarina xiamenensis]|nr:hypothetical protein [Idiomarina xiamenensis]
MKKLDALKAFSKYGEQGRYVYALSDLKKIFHEDGKASLRAGIKRLIEDNLLVRASNGVFVYSLHISKPSEVLEQIAKTLRRGEYNYVSLESALSEYGVISQVPVDRLTIMTTGRSAEYKTPFGTIEFTHTKRQITDILDDSIDVDRPLRLARVSTALRDLRRVGRNLHLLDQEVLNKNR